MIYLTPRRAEISILSDLQNCSKDESINGSTLPINSIKATFDLSPTWIASNTYVASMFKILMTFSLVSLIRSSSLARPLVDMTQSLICIELLTWMQRILNMRTSRGFCFATTPTFPFLSLIFFVKFLIVSLHIRSDSMLCWIMDISIIRKQKKKTHFVMSKLTAASVSCGVPLIVVNADNPWIIVVTRASPAATKISMLFKNRFWWSSVFTMEFVMHWITRNPPIITLPFWATALMAGSSRATFNWSAGYS